MTKPTLYVVTTYLPPIDPMQCALGPSFSRTHFPNIALQITKHMQGPMFPCIDLTPTGANCFSKGPGSEGPIFWVDVRLAEPNLYRIVAGKQPMDESKPLSHWMPEGSRMELVIDHLCNNGRYNNICVFEP